MFLSYDTQNYLKKVSGYIISFGLSGIQQKMIQTSKQKHPLSLHKDPLPQLQLYTDAYHRGKSCFMSVEFINKKALTQFIFLAKQVAEKFLDIWATLVSLHYQNLSTFSISGLLPLPKLSNRLVKFISEELFLDYIYLKIYWCLFLDLSRSCSQKALFFPPQLHKQNN